VSQSKEQALRENAFLRGRVARLEAALQADIAKVQGALFRGIDRLAQAQQIVVGSLDNVRAIMTVAENHTRAYEATPTVVPCPGCKSNRTVMVNSQKVRLHDRYDCSRLQEELG
jgi:hypothetical protein